LCPCNEHLPPPGVTGPQWGIVLFPSVQGAVRTERLLERAGIEQKLIPIPRHISSGCGFCLRFVWCDRARVEEILAAHKVTFERILPLD
jgi:hypothetical protein